MPIDAEEPRTGRAAPHQPLRRLPAPPAGDHTGADYFQRSASARIRPSRVRGWRKPVGAVVVARPTRWGNPFRVGETYMWLAATGTSLRQLCRRTARAECPT
ncbi:DUF4326 domain-containing protein [Blastococcus sp. URHD0036]|uniref:DUF4326 domain-containing protein n=1 Tax=Blastococcus sp. URHD0036 TaxID=1380356 RepID=UPI0009DD9B4B